MIVAETYETFAEAVLKKLVTEIAEAPAAGEARATP